MLGIMLGEQTVRLCEGLSDGVKQGGESCRQPTIKERKAGQLYRGEWKPNKL